MQLVTTELATTSNIRIDRVAFLQCKNMVGWRLLNHRCNVLIFIEKLNAVFAIIPPLVPHIIETKHRYAASFSAM